VRKITRILHAFLTHLHKTFHFPMHKSKSSYDQDRKRMRIARLHIRRVK